MARRAQQGCVSKKLQEVATAWAGGGSTDNKRCAESLAAAGAPPEMVDRVSKQQNMLPEIQPANALTVHLFFAAATQWNYAGMAGVRTGLNYTALELRASKVPDYASLPLQLQSLVWDGITIMERTCLNIWSTQSK